MTTVAEPQVQSPIPPVQLTAIQQITCSSISGSLGIFVGFPFDSIKTKLQTQRQGQYKGVIDCFTKVIREEGFLRLYSGLMAPLSVAAIRQSVIFGSNRVFNNLLEVGHTTFNHHKHDPYEGYYLRKLHELEDEIEDQIHHALENKNFKLLLSGMMTGVCNSFVVTPSDQIKIQVQSGQSNDMIKTLRHIYAKRGFMNGIYRGWRSSLARELLYYGSYFISYEYYRHILARINPFSEHYGYNVPSQNIFHPATMFNTLLAGGFAGCTSWIVNMPADYVKSRLQSDSMDNPKYKGIIDCAKKSYTTHGTLKVFYTGLVPTLTRAFPVHATILLSYELLKQWIV